MQRVVLKRAAGIGLAAGMALSACGGSQKKRPTTPAVEVKRADGEPNIARAPVKAPTDLKVILRVQNLARDWSRFTSPFASVTEVQQLTALPLEEFLPLMIGEELTDYLDLSSPMQVALFIPHHKRSKEDYAAIVSFKAKNYEDAVQRLEEAATVEVIDGGYRFSPSIDDETPFVTAKTRCELYHDAGQDSGHMYCAEDSELLSSRVRYLRTRFQIPSADMLELEVPNVVFQEFRKQRVKARGTTQGPGQEAMRQTVDAFLEQTHGVLLGLSIADEKEEPTVDASLSVWGSSKGTSLLSQIVLGKPGEQAVERELLQLPEDTTFAVRLGDTRSPEYSGALAQLIKTYFDEIPNWEIEPEGRQALEKSYTSLLTSSGTIIAAGIHVEVVRSRLLALFDETSSPSEEQLEDAYQAGEPWILVGLKTNTRQWMQTYLEMLRDDARYSYPQLKALRKQSGSASVPQLLERRAPAGMPDEWAYNVTAGSLPSAPKGTQHRVTYKVKRESEAPERAVVKESQHMLIWAGTDFVWVCTSQIADTCSARLKTLADMDKTDQRRGEWPKVMTQHTGSIAGYLSLVGVTAFVDTESAQAVRKDLDTMNLLSGFGALTSKPLLFTGNTEDTAQVRVRRVTSSVELKELVQDILQVMKK